MVFFLLFLPISHCCKRNNRCLCGTRILILDIKIKLYKERYKPTKFGSNKLNLQNLKPTNPKQSQIVCKSLIPLFIQLLILRKFYKLISLRENHLDLLDPRALSLSLTRSIQDFDVCSCSVSVSVSVTVSVVVSSRRQLWFLPPKSNP